MFSINKKWKMAIAMSMLSCATLVDAQNSTGTNYLVNGDF